MTLWKQSGLIGLAILSSLLAMPSSVVAVDVFAIPDRDRVPLGGELRVKILVRKGVGKPVVQPPRVPDCRIELLGSGPVASGPMGLTQRPVPGSRRSGGPTGAPIFGAITNLENQLQKTLADQEKFLGQGGSPITPEMQEMLRAYRQEALGALQGPNGSDFQAVYRVVPERSGILTLPSFIVESSGKAYLTRPIEITVEGAAAAAPPASPEKPRAANEDRASTQDNPAKTQTEPSRQLPAPHAPESVLGYGGIRPTDWPWVAAILLGPLAVLLIWAVGSLWSRHRVRTAPERELKAATRSALQSIRQALARDLSPEETASVMVQYVRARCQLPSGEITPAEADAALRRCEVSSELAERFAEILDACSAHRFMGGSAAVAVGELVREARDVILKIEKSGR